MRRRIPWVVALVAVAVLTLPSSVDADPSWKDTIPENGGPGDHGWFEAGRQWVGDFGDPTVVKSGSTYYAYASPVGGRYLPVLTSTDLRTWTIHPNWSTNGPPGAPGYNVDNDTSIPTEIRQAGNAAGWNDWDIYLHNDGLVRAPTWGVDGERNGVDVDGPWIERAYWAPGVIQIGATWYAYGAVRTSWDSDDPNGYGRFCLTVASAPSPLGPFRDVSGAGPIQCAPQSTDPGGSIDPFPYRDPGTGKHYLLWKASGKLGGAESSIRAVEIGNDGKPLSGSSVKLLETNRNDPWEGGTIENPGMVSFGGTTYLFYSANDSNADSSGVSNYATGYAVCPSGPTGPCERIVHSPLLASNGFDQGPGGSSPFVGPDGRLRVAYATFWWGETPRDNGLRPRRLHIAVLDRNGDGTLRYLGDEEDVPAPTAPPAPPAPSVVAGNGFIHVAWSPPSSTGGMPITGYTVTRSPGGATCVTGALPRSCEFSGLANGTPYTFTVKATNSIGTGPPSTASAAAVPAVPPDVLFHPLTPVRILDTRAATKVGPFGTPWGQGESRDISVGGTNGVPPGADAVVLNVTATGPSAASFLKLFPAGQPRPAASNLNWVTGQTIANAVTVKLGAGGKLTGYNSKGAVDVIVDVVGYYDDGGAGFTAVNPTRIVDSRASKAIGGYSTPWAAGATREVTVAGTGVGPDDVPAGADAVVLNVTATNTTAASHLTVWPAGEERPTASSLNWPAGATVPNAVTVKVGSDGKVAVVNSKGTTDVIVDVVGYYDEGSGAAFHPLVPARIQDSRQPAPVGLFGTPWGPAVTRSVPVAGVGGVPADAEAVLTNTTVTNTTADSHLTVWPTGLTKPTASSLNWSAGQSVPNAVTARVGSSGRADVISPKGTTDVIIDVAGWFG